MSGPIVIMLSLVLVALSAWTPSEAGDANPAALADRNQTGWADWEAQARMTDGDYEGALQAEQQAASDRHRPDARENAAPSPRR